MQRFAGENVYIYLKDDDKLLSGILLEIDNKFVFIQNSNNSVTIIPFSNIKYCTAPQFHSEASKFLDNKSHISVASEASNLLNISIDNEPVVKIPVPPGMNLSVITKELQDMIWNNPSVQDALHGRVIKQMEYNTGHANIITDNTESANKIINTNQENSFNASTHSPLTEKLSPTAMAVRLSNKTTNGETNNET